MTADNIKRALKTCSVPSACIGCVYKDADECIRALITDALDLIDDQDERIAIMRESMEALEKRCNTLNALEALEKRQEDPDRIKVTRCKDCRYFEPSNAEEGDYSGYCRNDYAPCQNQTVEAWWFCGSAERG